MGHPDGRYVSNDTSKLPVAYPNGTVNGNSIANMNLSVMSDLLAGTRVEIKTLTQMLQKGGKKKKSSEKVVEKSVGKKKPDKEEKEKVRKKKETRINSLSSLSSSLSHQSCIPNHSDQMSQR